MSLVHKLKSVVTLDQNANSGSSGLKRVGANNLNKPLRPLRLCGKNSYLLDITLRARDSNATML